MSDAKTVTPLQRQARTQPLERNDKRLGPQLLALDDLAQQHNVCCLTHALRARVKGAEAAFDLALSAP